MSEAMPAVMSSVPTARTRGCPFDPPEDLRKLRQERPLTRMAYPDGHMGWLATGYATVRSILADPRFSARIELIHLPAPLAKASAPPMPALPGFFGSMDRPEHTRYRQLLTGQFTVHRIKQLEPRIRQITEEHLDAMERSGPPADLVEAFALPIPSLVICELLGVPYTDRERFQANTAVVLTFDVTPEQRMTALADLAQFLRQIVRSKRATPTDDLLGGLAAGSDLTDEELTNIAMLLLTAGHETTANMLALGTFALLEHPDQLAALRSDPSLVAHAVEELLRYLTIVQGGTFRTALEDVELDGQLVKAGETVTLSLLAANHDLERFDDPDRLDLGREDVRHHLAFGHGIHQCLGQQLARIELRIGYTALLRRFPTLRLAVPPDEVPTRDTMKVYGVHRLPVTW